MSQTRFLQQLRSRLYTGDKAKKTAIAAVESQMSTANDGSFVLGRYQDAENNIRTIIGVNYINGGVNSMSIYDFDKIESDALLARVSTVETTLGISEDGTVTGETIVGRIEDVEKLLEVLNGTETVEGSIKKQIKDAVDAEAVIARAAEKANADNIASEVSARTAADTQIRTDFAAADTALKDELMGDVSDTDAKTIAALNDKIESVEGAAKSYSIVEVTEGLGTNVKEAWKLVDEDGFQSGSQINIYKDSSLQKVELVNQELSFTYILADGSNSTVGVDVSDFLAESEFGNGLLVTNHIVSVKVAEDSETFLSVSEDGVKLSGVQNAIDKVNTSLTSTIDSFKTEYTTKVANLEAKDTNLESAINGEETERKDADSKLQAQLDVITGTGDSSVSTKITNAINALDSEVKGEGTFVDVTVTQVDGVITEVSVAESDIASATALTEEVNRAKAAEKENSDAIAVEKSRAEGQEVAIRSEFASADTTLKNTLLGDAAEGYNTLGKLEDAIQAVDAKVEALDVEDGEVVGSYVTEVDQVNGKISTVKKSLVSSANENNMLVADTTNGGLTLSTVWDCGTFEYELPSTEG